MNLDYILSKLKSGANVTKEEESFISHKLDAYKNHEELEQAIRAFGLINDATFENIMRIEKYLSCQSDIVLSGAIKVLCDTSYWGLAESYSEKFKQFLKKEDAFELSETQISVFSVMGEYLNSKRDPGLFRYVYEMFLEELKEYNSDNDFFEKVRLEQIYHCLDVGIRGQKAKSEYRAGRMKIPDDVNEEVLSCVRNLI